MIERDAKLTYVILALAIVWPVCLYFRRWTIAVVAFIAETVVGVIVLQLWLDTAVKNEWLVYSVAATVALTGMWALIAKRPTTHRT